MLRVPGVKPGVGPKENKQKKIGRKKQDHTSIFILISCIYIYAFLLHVFFLAFDSASSVRFFLLFSSVLFC